MNYYIYLRSLLLVGILTAGLVVSAQEKGNKNVVKETRDLPAFHSVDAGGALDITILLAEKQEVVVETDENLLDNVKTSVKEGVLYIKSSTLKNPTVLKANIRMTDLEMIRAGGATEISSPASIKVDNLSLIASGATSIVLELEVQSLHSEASGAADLVLRGTAVNHTLDASGAASIRAKSLVTSKTNYQASGASDVRLNATDELIGDQKGVADVSYVGNPSTTITTGNSKEDDKGYVIYSDNYYDSVKVKVGGINVQVYEGDDSVRVIVGDREVRVDDEGNVRYYRNKRPKFNGHWAGVEIGLNGYLNTEGNQSFPPEYEYLDLRMTKSIAFNLNFFEQNIPLSKNRKWGMVTGLGLEWHNYRFSRNTRLNSDSSSLIGYIDRNISIRKSKLTTLYLNVPLLFEFQTNHRHKKNSFHIGIGMVAGARLSSHTKKYYNELNKDFDITRYNPATGQYETEFLATSPGHSKAKTFDDFFLQPFKFDATVRIGWGFINLFATYSVNQMFKDGKGPELYPWTIGITLVNF